MRIPPAREALAEDRVEGGPGDDASAQDPDWASDDFMSAIVLRPRPPYCEWVRQQLESRGEPMGEDVVAPSVVIAPELPRQQDRDAWLAVHHESLFECQLAPLADPSRWPADLSLDALRDWFDIEIIVDARDMRHLPLRPLVSCDPISLQLVLDELNAMPPDATLYVDVASGHVVSFTEDEIGAIDDDDPDTIGVSPDDLEALRSTWESETLVPVLTGADFDELAAMREFAASQPQPSRRARLMASLRGRKASRRFDEVVTALGLVDEWSAWREQEIAGLTRVVLDQAGIPYTDDTGPGGVAQGAADEDHG